jgi:hypothetical protein
MNGLTRVIYSCIVMTYGPRQRCPKGRTSESCSRVAAAVRSTAQCRRAFSTRLFDFCSTSIPLFATGSAVEGASACERIQAGIYGKASAQLDPARAVVRICQKDLNQRSRESSARGAAATRGRAWLRRSQPWRAAFNWSITLIDCRQTNWLRYISCSCRSGGEQSETRSLNPTHLSWR